MRNENPAALPLIAFIAGLTAGPLLVNPYFAAIALVAVAILHRRSLALFAALGVVLALHVQASEFRERTTFATLHPERFAILQAPLERDWAPRAGSFVLRASRFRANGIVFDTPIAIYARFEPPPIAMEASVRAEAFLRLNDRGEYTAAVKSSELLSYEGRLSPLTPRAWNRMLALRLAPHAATHEPEVALAEALLLGRGERLSEETRAGFRRGGTYHLLVFSGLQIAFAAGVLAWLLRWLRAPRASDWLLLAFAVIAPLFIGPTASVSRASVGIGLYALSRIARRPTSFENLWCVAALVRLILEPRDLTEASFHLTYAGAAALVYVGRGWLARIAAAEITITPLTLFHFHQYALGGSLLTLAMAPLILAMLIASALACAFPCTPVFILIRVLHRACGALNAFGFAGYLSSPPLPALAIGAFGALLAVALLRERQRAVAIALAMLIPTGAAIVRFASLREVEHPTITFFDVGQGDAIAVRSGTHTVLVDGGADARILPLLVDRGIRRIDAVVLTHAHPDHCGGLPHVVEQLDVGAVWISPRRFRGDCASRLLEACSATATPIRLLRDGDRRAIGDVALTAIIPDRTFRRAAENNASVVLRLQAAGRTILLTGDIEREAEIHLSDRDLRADVLKVAHHGSRSSTAPSFLDAVAPRIAVVSCGRRNLFGHPHPSVLEALRERNIRTWRTDLRGTIDVEIRRGKLYVPQ